MPEYTYRFADLLSDADVAELELSNVRFDRRIIQPSQFTANITVTNSEVAQQVKKVVPARTVVHVYRDADIWGTFIIWSMRIRSSNRQGVVVEFTGASLESWFYRRIVDIDMLFTNTEQLDIARQLIDQAQTGWTPYEANANLGINYTTNDTGVPRDREYLLSDAASVGQRLEELASVDNGFEYMINTYYDEATETRKREFQLDTTLNDDTLDVVFTYPGSILEYSLDYDATDSATAWWARGDTIDDDVTGQSEPLITQGPVLSDEWLQNGFPHLDKVVNYSSVVVLETLEDYALWWKDNHSGLWAVPTIEINTTDTTIIPPSALGSSAQFTIIDEFFDIGDFTSTNRIIGIEVTPPERGRSETIRLVIETDVDPTEIGT